MYNLCPDSLVEFLNLGNSTEIPKLLLDNSSGLAVLLPKSSNSTYTHSLKRFLYNVFSFTSNYSQRAVKALKTILIEWE